MQVVFGHHLHFYIDLPDYFHYLRLQQISNFKSFFVFKPFKGKKKKEKTLKGAEFLDMESF